MCGEQVRQAGDMDGEKRVTSRVYEGNEGEMRLG